MSFYKQTIIAIQCVLAMIVFTAGTPPVAKSTLQIDIKHFVGQALLQLDSVEYKKFRQCLQLPRDAWRELHQPQDRGFTYIPDRAEKSGHRLNFVFIYDTLPLDSTSKHLHFERTECTILNEFADLKILHHLPIAATFTCSELSD